MLLFGFLVVSCATDTGPRFVDLRANKQQQIQQELETSWPRYIIYYIPEHAVLFDPKDDGNTLVVSSRWIKFEDDKTTWGYLVHEKIDLVALKVIDRNTMRIYYSPPRTEGL
jgi:hypothetical protein